MLNLPDEIFLYSCSITITLCFRPLGAAIFGVLADRYGRRYPLMADIILYSAMELASGFARNFSVFFAIRAIFGIAMGGEWGLGTALAMEVLPPETRGLFSGILQQGYAVGFLLASLLYYAVIENIGWRAMFWIGSCPALLVILIRFFVPESPVWEAHRNARKSDGKSFLSTTKLALKLHWKRFIYCVLLMSCFSFMSHGKYKILKKFKVSYFEIIYLFKKIYIYRYTGFISNFLKNTTWIYNSSSNNSHSSSKYRGYNWWLDLWIFIPTIWS
jgi:SHS family lactate transporter-like MFS transporter